MSVDRLKVKNIRVKRKLNDEILENLKFLKKVMSYKHMNKNKIKKLFHEIYVIKINNLKYHK